MTIRSFNPHQLIQESPAVVSSVPEVITHKFEDFSFSERLKDNIKQKGYVLPTPIQDKAIPEIMKGKDVIGIANTGTGKTAAFLIPLIDKILKDRREKALIICPTRELATQIQSEFYGFSEGMKILSVLCIGGVSEAPQIYNLRRQFNLVVGTPGRLKDHVKHQHLDLSKFTTIVLDEADLMVDMGFLPDVKNLISGLPAQRQALFFSATIDGRVQSILGDFVKNPVTISVRKQQTLQNIHQKLIKIIHESKKIDQLHDLLIQKDFEKVLIFGRTKHGTQKLTEDLVKRGFRAEVIHGNKSQGQRQRALDKFKNSLANILVATDIASRGLDIPNVSHVINYDLPESSDDYIHRIGRTGRAQQKGIALTFVN
jgi:superfamily II DNA/RNA helicase